MGKGNKGNLAPLIYLNKEKLISSLLVTTPLPHTIYLSLLSFFYSYTLSLSLPYLILIYQLNLMKNTKKKNVAPLEGKDAACPPLILTSPPLMLGSPWMVVWS